MLIVIEVVLEDEQVKGREQEIMESLKNSAEEVLYHYRDGLGRHSATINYDVIVREQK